MTDNSTLVKPGRYRWLLAAFGVAAVAVSAQPRPELRVRLIDDQTGFVIPSESAQLNVPATRVPAGRGEFSISGADRDRPLSVTADGYRPMTVGVPGGNHPLIEVRMTPNGPPQEFSTASLTALRQGGAVAIAGFVSDIAAGTPLPGVRVTVSGRPSSSVTNNRGFFSVTFPRPEGYSSEAGVDVDLTFARPEYKTIIRRHARVRAESVRKYRIAMTKGSGTETVDEAAARRQDGSANQPPAAAASASGGARGTAPLSPIPTLPATIRVGRNCTNATTCTAVEVAALEVYVKHVLPSEWKPSWLSASLEAGSVAVRSYGVWNTAHPKTSTYDICDNTWCQMYDPAVSEQTTDDAVDKTASNVLVESSGAVAFAEFSAENNNAGCGDGQTGTGTSSPCIPDAVCKGKPKNGHGRGMCQNGSQRWAAGKNADGTAAAAGPQKADWILVHYYPAYKVVKGH